MKKNETQTNQCPTQPNEPQTQDTTPNIAHHSNDKGYKKIFSIKKNFLDFIQKYVALDWMSGLTVNDLELIDKEFVTDQFETYESDLIYKVTKNGKEVYLFFLFELQSKNDYSMPFRILVYMTAVWMDYFKNSDKKERISKQYRLPMILPIVLHNGPTAWKAGRNFRELIKNEDLFGEYAVSFQYALVSVKELSKEKIAAGNTLVDNILFSDKIRSREEIPSYLREISRRVRQLETEDRNAWMNWFLHAFRYGSKEEKKQFIEMFQRGDDTMCSAMERIMNETWDEGRREGRQEGRREGRQEGRREGERKGISKGKILAFWEMKLPIEEIAEKVSMSLEQVRQILDENGVLKSEQG